MIAPRQWTALGVAAVVAVAMPSILLPPGPPRSSQPRAAVQPPVSAPEQPVLAAAFDRTLFAGVAPAVETPADAPALIGIVGRLDQDAVAIVRGADGTSRTLRIGESVDGWRLESLAIDAAFFTRGNERVRVPLPAG